MSTLNFRECGNSKGHFGQTAAADLRFLRICVSEENLNSRGFGNSKRRFRQTVAAVLRFFEEKCFPSTLIFREFGNSKRHFEQTAPAELRFSGVMRLTGTWRKSDRPKSSGSSLASSKGLDLLHPSTSRPRIRNLWSDLTVFYFAWARRLWKPCCFHPYDRQIATRPNSWF